MIEPSEKEHPWLYLRANDLKPGDVLLTHGTDSTAKTIAILAGGEYSHAALVLGSGLIYESDGENWIGYKSLLSPGWTKIAGEQVRLVTIPGDPIWCCVLRHQDMHAIRESQFQEALTELCLKTQGKDYSRWARLVPLVRRAPRLSKPIAARIARWRDARASKKESYLPGAFCSEVVASFFKELGLKVGQNGPELTAPHDFVQPGVRFDIKPSLVIKAEEVGEIFISERFFLPAEFGMKSMDAALEDHIQFTALAARAGQISKAFTATVRQYYAAVWDHTIFGMLKLQQDLYAQMASLEGHMLQAIVIGDEGAIRRAKGLIAKFTDKAIPKFAKPFTKESTPEELQRFNLDFAELTCSRARCQALLVCAMIRKRMRSLDRWLSWRKRCQLSIQRRKMLEDARRVVTHGIIARRQFLTPAG